MTLLDLHLPVLDGIEATPHINRIFAKTGSANRAAAGRYAYRHGLG